MVPQFGPARCGSVDVGLGGVRVMRWCPSSVRPGVVWWMWGWGA